MVASAHATVCGPPALFTAACFPELLAMRSDEGARSLLRARMNEVATIPINGSRDLDTLADYTDYLSNQL